MTNIAEKYRRAFEALTGGKACNFYLLSCFVSGESTAAIAAATVCPPTEDGGEPEYVISPLVISVTPRVKLVDPDGRKACGAQRTPLAAGSRSPAVKGRGGGVRAIPRPRPNV